MQVILKRSRLLRRFLNLLNNQLTKLIRRIAIQTKLNKQQKARKKKKKKSEPINCETNTNINNNNTNTTNNTIAAE